MRTAPAPSSVTVLTPSITVSRSVGSEIVAVMVMVAGAAPQLNVTIPPAASAVASAAAVHESAAPSPTTCVGVATSAGRVGAAQSAGGGDAVWAAAIQPA